MKKTKLNLSYDKKNFEVVVEDKNGNKIQNLFIDPKVLKIGNKVKLLINNDQHIVEMEKDIFLDFMSRGIIDKGVLKGEFLFFESLDYCFSDVDYIKARSYNRILNTVRNNKQITNYEVGHCYRLLNHTSVNTNSEISMYLGKKYCITDRSDTPLVYGDAWITLPYNENYELKHETLIYKCKDNTISYEEITDQNIINKFNDLKNNLEIEIPCCDDYNEAQSLLNSYNGKYSSEKFSYYGK